MTRSTPSLEAIIADFEREIARAPRWAQVDRALLQRLIDDHRRLEEYEIAYHQTQKVLSEKHAYEKQLHQALHSELSERHHVWPATDLCPVCKGTTPTDVAAPMLGGDEG